MNAFVNDNSLSLKQINFRSVSVLLFFLFIFPALLFASVPSFLVSWHIFKTVHTARQVNLHILYELTNTVHLNKLKTTEVYLQDEF